MSTTIIHNIPFRTINGTLPTLRGDGKQPASARAVRTNLMRIHCSLWGSYVRDLLCNFSSNSITFILLKKLSERTDIRYEFLLDIVPMFIAKNTRIALAEAYKESGAFPLSEEMVPKIETVINKVLPGNLKKIESDKEALDAYFANLIGQLEEIQIPLIEPKTIRRKRAVVVDNEEEKDSKMSNEMVIEELKSKIALLESAAEESIRQLSHKAREIGELTNKVKELESYKDEMEPIFTNAVASGANFSERYEQAVALIANLNGENLKLREQNSKLIADNKMVIEQNLKLMGRESKDEISTKQKQNDKSLPNIVGHHQFSLKYEKKKGKRASCVVSKKVRKMREISLDDAIVCPHCGQIDCGRSRGSNRGVKQIVCQNTGGNYYLRGNILSWVEREEELQLI